MAASENRDSFGRQAFFLVKFSLPLMLSGILQQLYNWADAFIVGNVVGELALAAVGSTTSMVNFYVLAITGFTLGLSILFAQKYGSRQLEDLPRLLSTFLWVLGLAFLVLAGLGMCFTRQLLQLLPPHRQVLAHLRRPLSLRKLAHRRLTPLRRRMPPHKIPLSLKSAPRLQLPQLRVPASSP